MAIKYYARESKSALSDNKTYYYAQAVIDEQVSQQTIIDRIVEKSSLSEGDVMSCVTELFKEMTSEMLEGHSVKLDNFGSFSLTVQSKAQETAEKVTTDTIENCRISFRPSTRWYETIKPRVRYQKVAKPEKKGNSSGDDGTSTGGGSSSGTGGGGMSE